MLQLHLEATVAGGRVQQWRLICFNREDNAIVEVRSGYDSTNEQLAVIVSGYIDDILLRALQTGVFYTGISLKLSTNSKEFYDYVIKPKDRNIATMGALLRGKLHSLRIGFYVHDKPPMPNLHRYTHVVWFDASYNHKNGYSKLATVIKHGKVTVARSVSDCVCNDITNAECCALEFAINLYMTGIDDSIKGNVAFIGDNMHLVDLLTTMSNVTSYNSVERIDSVSAKLSELDASVLWVPSKHNRADALTRHKYESRLYMQYQKL